ncbi:NAD(P)H-hydrate dehydratase [Rhizobium sp. G21]|uniref:NAD(P)H-hydrate dehydratase n=1 Tax=Rhizobium sp. G21 TaxID=2758439 RepID=UPI0016026543|nr:NAD(P)H-hydrate dehydratase [Rhizobium sp. G21]MBB1247682.1 NAD(P)H-hydrate dehydratase [Rhizobium sp. G21]
MSNIGNMLIEPQAVAAIDAACIASGISSYALMLRAGRAVAAAALRRYPGSRRFAVLCGPGNNGGDGYLAASALAEAGAEIAVFALAPPSTEDAKRACADAACATQPLSAYEPATGDVVIDALFGAGLSRDLSPDVITVVETVKAARVPVLAVDIPSGLCGHSGRARGGAFAAEATVTFVAAKPGQILLPGRALCGEIEIADIGVPQRFLEQHAGPVRLNAPDLWTDLLADKSSAGHKYSHGSLAVFSGGAMQTGAARLSAFAGLRGGAGLVTVISPAEAASVHAAQLTAVMLKTADNVGDLEAILDDARLNAFVLGPGFGVGEQARDFARMVKDRRVVLDADAITSFREDPDALFSAFAGEPRLVLTPHDGEFARLFPDLASDEALSKVDRALAAAARANAAVILKGADTVIASPDGRAAINTNAPPWLATAGSGDVLAGLCGALLARGLPVYEAACAAVWHHGEAGSRAGRGLTAETLINFIDV